MPKEQNIILIGAMRAGKSTIAQLLSKELERKLVDVDEIRWGYYAEIGYDEEHVRKIMQKGGGYVEMLQYWKPFEAHTVERVLSDYDSSIIDFGAGHTVYEDPALFARVKHAFSPFKHVFLVSPCADVDESVEILNQRMTVLLEKEVGEVYPEVLEINAHFVKHPSNRQLAKEVVYTGGKTPEESCLEILELIDSQ